MARLVIRSGMVVTMDRDVPDLPQGDVLVEDGRIAAVAPKIAADDAEVIDAAGMIVMPGLVNAHIHAWQTAVRGVAADWTILRISPQYACRDCPGLHAGRHFSLESHGRAGAAQCRHDHDRRLVPQQSDRGAYRSRDRWPRGGGSSRAFPARLTQARCGAGPEAFQRDSPSARRGRAPLAFAAAVARWPRHLGLGDSRAGVFDLRGDARRSDVGARARALGEHACGGRADARPRRLPAARCRGARRRHPQHRPRQQSLGGAALCADAARRLDHRHARGRAADGFRPLPHWSAQGVGRAGLDRLRRRSESRRRHVHDLARGLADAARGR